MSVKSFKDEFKDDPVEGAMIALMWVLAGAAMLSLVVLLLVVTRGIILVLPAFFGLTYLWLKREAKR